MRSEFKDKQVDDMAAPLGTGYITLRSHRMQWRKGISTGGQPKIVCRCRVCV